MPISNQKNGRFTYAMTSLSFIPYLGFLFAPIIIIWGLVRGGKGGNIIASIGLIGLLSTWLMAMGVDHFAGIQHDNFHQDKYLKHIISDIVQSIESFKSYEGAYPKTLEVFKPESAQGLEIRLGKDTIDRLFYEVTEGGNNYFLLGIGPDNKPFTTDDILAAIVQSSSEPIGLIIKENLNPGT